MDTVQLMRNVQGKVHAVGREAWNRGGRDQEVSERRIDVHVVGRPFLMPKSSGGARGERAGPDCIEEAYLEHGAEVLADLDGAFAVVVQDHERQETHVVTDRLNVVPMYAGSARGCTAVAAHPDVLARHLGIETDFDLTTMAQALQMWYATFPYTYYRGIYELEPATVHTWDREGDYSAWCYWEAQYRGDPAGGHGALAEQLAAAIEGGVRRRVAGANTPGLLLSAGADSRGILFSAVKEKPITCYTFYDEPNAEMKLAARLAEAAGQEFVGLRRDAEHYGASARASTRLIGGMWNFLDGHAIGFAPRFREDTLDLLLTGDFADLLYKGSGLNITYRKLLGKNLPIKEVGRFSSDWRTPGMRVQGAVQAQIEARVRCQYEGIDTRNLDDEGWWEVVHRRVCTLSRTGSIGGPISLQRALPWDTFMADRAMTEVYERLTTAARVDGGVWEAAIKQLTPPAARNIPNNNWGARVGASGLEKTVRFLYGVAYRKIRRRDVDGTPLGSGVTRGSWPNFAYYLAHSPVVTRLWQPDNAAVAEVLKEVAGFDPWRSHTPVEVRRSGMYFGRLLTQKLWLEERLSP